jgi:hypothetical protein
MQRRVKHILLQKTGLHYFLHSWRVLACKGMSNVVLFDVNYTNLNKIGSMLMGREGSIVAESPKLQSTLALHLVHGC